jgi:DNA-binding NarL/FixJ family response regulator
MTQGTDKARTTPGAAAARAVTIAALDLVPIYREGLNAVVSRTAGLRWVGHAGSHHASLQLCEKVRPNIVAVDSALDPQCHLVRLLTESDPALIAVVLVRDHHRSAAFVSAAHAAGAHGIASRNADPRNLVEALHRSYTERRYRDPSLASLAARTAPRTPSTVEAARWPDRASMPLSRREYQVLQLVAEGMENSAIAKTLYLSVETVRTHVKSILRKLSARDRTHAVTKAFRAGILVLRGEPQSSHEHDGGSAAPRALS